MKTTNKNLSAYPCVCVYKNRTASWVKNLFRISALVILLLFTKNVVAQEYWINDSIQTTSGWVQTGSNEGDTCLIPCSININGLAYTTQSLLVQPAQSIPSTEPTDSEFGSSKNTYRGRINMLNSGSYKGVLTLPKLDNIGTVEFAISLGTNNRNFVVEYSTDSVNWTTETVEAGLFFKENLQWYRKEINSTIPTWVRVRTASSNGTGIQIWYIRASKSNPADTDAPLLSSTTPSHQSTVNAADVTELVLSFDEKVKEGTAGDVTLYKNSAVFETVNYSNLDFTTDNIVKVPLQNILDANSNYYVNVSSGAITDLVGNPYVGISDNSTWTFTTSSTLSAEKKLFNFNVNGQECTTAVDEENKILNLSVAYATDLLNLTVSCFDISPAATLKMKDEANELAVGSTVACTYVNGAQDSGSFTLVVTAQDASTQEYIVSLKKISANSEKELTKLELVGQRGESVYSGDSIYIKFSPDSSLANRKVSALEISNFASANISVGEEIDVTNDKTITVTAQNLSTKDYTLRVTNAASNEAVMTEFRIGTHLGVIRNDSILLEIPYTPEGVTALVPTFKRSQYAKVYVGSDEQESGVTANDFTSTVEYKVLAEDGVSNTVYKAVVTMKVAVTGLILTENFDYDINTLLAGSTEGETSSITGWTLASQNSGAANPTYARVEAQNLEYAKYSESGTGKAIHSYTPNTAPSGGSWTGAGSVNILSRKVFENDGEIASGDVYAAFLLNVATSAGSNTSGTEVFGLYDPNSEGPLARVWVRRGNSNNSGKYYLGVSKNASGSGLTTDMLYPGPGTGVPNDGAPMENSTHLVVLKYSFNSSGSDVVSLFLDPTPGEAEPQPVVTTTDGNDLNSIKGIIIRQAGTTPSEFYVGGIRVATTWDDAVAKQADDINANIESFELASAPFKYVINSELDTLFITTLKQENLTGITPTITLEGAGASISPASGVAQNFSYTPNTYVKYTVTAANGSTTRDYYVRAKSAEYIINNEFNAQEGWTEEAAVTTGIKSQPISIGEGIYTDSIYYFNTHIKPNDNGSSGGDGGCSAGRLQIAGSSTNKGYVELRNLPSIGTITLYANSGSSSVQPEHALLQIKEEGETEWRTVGTINVNAKTCTGYSQVINTGNSTSIRIQNNITSSMYLYSLQITSYDDNEPPVVSEYSPANNATEVSLTTDLVLTFNEKIQVGVGNITIHNDTDGTDDIIDVTDGDKVIVGDKTLTITPTALQVAKTYHVKIDAGVVTDLSGNAYAGIADANTWKFSTVATARTGNDVTKLSMKLANGDLVQESAATIDEPTHTVTISLVYGDYSSALLKVDSIEVSDGARVNRVASTCHIDSLYTLSEINATNNTVVVEAENGTTQAWTLVVNIAPNKEANILDISIAGETTVSKVVGDTVYINTIGIIDTANRIPTITLSDGATVSPNSGVAQTFSYYQAVNYTVTAEAGNQKTWYVILQQAASPAFLSYGILNSSISGVYGLTAGASVVADTIDHENKVVNITLPYGSNIAQPMIAKFTLTDLAEAYVGSTLQQDSITPNGYSTPLVYTIRAGSTSETWTVNVSVKQLPQLLVAETFDYSVGYLTGNKVADFYNDEYPTLYMWEASNKATDSVLPPLSVVDVALTYEPQGIPYIHSGEGKSVLLGDATTKRMEAIRYVDGTKPSERINSGSIYASFMFNADTATNNWREFFEFVEGSTLGNSVRGRVWAKISSDRSSVLVAATKTGNSPSEANAIQIPRHQTSLIVLRYTYGYDGVDAAIAITNDPIPGSSEPASNAWKIHTSASETNSSGNYAVGILRQDASVKARISGLRVALSWAEAVKPGDFESTPADFEYYAVRVGDEYITATPDKDNKIVKVLVPENTDLSNLVARFTLSYGATAYDLNDVEQISDVTPVNFSDTVVYKILPLAGDPVYWKVIATTDDDTETGVSKDNLRLTYYPNPVQEVLYIKGEEEISKIEVYNISGRLVLSIINSESVPMSALPSGVYFVKVVGISNTSKTIRVIK